MKTKLWLVLLSLMVMRSAFAAPLTAAQSKALQTLYAKQDKALKSKDVEVLVAQTDVNFQRKANGETRTGQKTEREYIALVFRQIRSMDAVKTTIVSSDFASQKIVVVARTTFSGVFRDANGKWTKQSFATDSRDTWIATKSGWKTRLTEYVS